MILYDFECPVCHAVFEEMAQMGDQEAVCPACSATAERLVSLRGAHRPDAPWVADCTIAFAPEDERPAVRRYLSTPTDRVALRAAMRAAGIRHLDAGEPTRRENRTLDSRKIRELVERHKYRRGQL